MSLQSFSEWLRCPNCFLPLVAVEPLRLVCSAGHSFDSNKRGFLNVVRHAHRFIGDSADMLDARAMFLGLGYYDDLRRTVAEKAAVHGPARILDIGCGSGFYLDAVLKRVGGPSALRQAMAVDISPAAVQRTVRALPGVSGLVADVWSPLPLRDECADVILNVFAPRNASEFHRVLAPTGLLIVVVPQDHHLHELRLAGLALGVQPHKADHLERTLGEHFTLSERTSLESTMTLDDAGIRALLGMGPSAHHGRSEATTDQLRPETGLTQVTAAFEVLSFHPIAPSPAPLPDSLATP